MNANMYGVILVVIAVVVIITVVYSTSSSSTNSTKSEVNRLIHSMQLSPEEADGDPTDSGITGTYSIRDYYIFSSYNSCNNNSSNTNNTIDTQTLKNVIAQGVRLLDFEIYSLQNQPIVATSSIPNNYYIKESNTSVLFRNVFDSIINTAFNISTCPNPTDPLFVHLRIQSTNQKMFSNMATIFKNYQNTGYILGPQYSFEYQDCTDNNNNINCSVGNISSLPLNTFKSKIIIMIDKQNTNVLDNSDLMEFCNIMTNSTNCRLITNYEMKNSPDQNELINFNKQSMTIVTPDISPKPSNPSISTANLLGIQFTAINFSNKDSNYKTALNNFSDSGNAFILKPADLRYIPVTIQVPDDPPPSYSFAPRSQSARYYNFQI
jgi:hypothetical protein